jgi:hypothetical protein
MNRVWEDPEVVPELPQYREYDSRLANIRVIRGREYLPGYWRTLDFVVRGRQAVMAESGGNVARTPDGCSFSLGQGQDEGEPEHREQS